jgi:hypothetical protein
MPVMVNSLPRRCANHSITVRTTAIIQTELQYAILPVQWKLVGIVVLGVLWHVQWFWVTVRVLWRSVPQKSAYCDYGGNILILPVFLYPGARWPQVLRVSLSLSLPPSVTTLSLWCVRSMHACLRAGVCACAPLPAPSPSPSLFLLPFSLLPSLLPPSP